jgi:superkiller protein 3
VWLVTNRHVVIDRLSKEPGETIEVEFFSELSPARRPRYRAILQHYTSTTETLDLAVLRIEGVPDDIVALTMRPGRIQRGAEVEIIGHPFNEPDPWSRASGEVRNYYPDSIEMPIDAKVATGYSGGPVFLQGSQEVIAIVVSIREQGDAAATADQPTNIPEGAISIGEVCVTYPIEIVIEKLREWGVYN